VTRAGRSLPGAQAIQHTLPVELQNEVRIHDAPPVRFLFSDKYNIRGLLVGFECEHLSPIRLDKKMIVSGRVVDKYVKRNREYFVVEARCVDEDGLEIFRTRRTHVLDYIPRTAPREGYGLDSGVLKEPGDERRH
jgi:hypothetical protein